ncbi:MAG: RNA polymerase ECF-type sigma factor, partial [uncultured Rubellimicrobium sp.]
DLSRHDPGCRRDALPRFRSGGACAPAGAVGLCPEAPAAGGGCRGSRAGHDREGAGGAGPLSGRDQPEGLAFHHHAQFLQLPLAARPARSDAGDRGDRGQRGDALDADHRPVGQGGDRPNAARPDTGPSRHPDPDPRPGGELRGRGAGLRLFGWHGQEPPESRPRGSRGAGGQPL